MKTCLKLKTEHMNITKITKANTSAPKEYAVLPLHITPVVLYMHYRSGDKSHLVFSESRIRGRDWGFEFFTFINN